jgi:hypothetical protein
MNLIKFITKFDIKKENMAQIESIFAKVITAEEKYIMVGWKSKIRKFGRKASKIYLKMYIVKMGIELRNTKKFGILY